MSPPVVRPGTAAPATPVSTPADLPPATLPALPDDHFTTTGYRAAFDGGPRGNVALVAGHEVTLSERGNGREPSFIAEAGKPLTVVVDPGMFDRAARVDVKIRFGDEVRSARLFDGEVDRRTGARVFSPGVIDVPDGAHGTARLTFEVTDQDGGVDTQWSGPHQDVVIAPQGGGQVTLGEDFSLGTAGEIRAGETLQVGADIDRLRALLGASVSSATLFVSINGDAPKAMPLAVDVDGDGAADGTMVANLPLPHDAQNVAMWVKVEGEGRTAWDSNYGNNFTFEVGLTRPDADPQWKRYLLSTPSFPGLNEDNFVAVGPFDGGYNCIAWSVGVRDEWVWPGERVPAFDALYQKNGYAPQDDLDTSPEPGVQKVALFGFPSGAVTHAAVQDDKGRWMSKLGTEPLIRHEDAKAVEGPSYGQLIKVYRRRLEA